jgi:site-specific DNA-cytosine methylase
MITAVTQRWRAGRASYRPAGEVVDVRRLDVAVLDNDTTPRAFVEAHHYSRSYPAARRRFGLYRGADLVGVAVFSQPVSEALLDCLPGERLARLELGRFVLLDDTGANAETWFLGPCFEALRAEGFAGVVSLSDPVARVDQAGAATFPGHVGTIYQAHNAVFLGRATARTLRLLPDGTVLNARARQKLLAGLRMARAGWRPGHVDLIGNVPGLDNSTNWPTLQRALAPLGHDGYCIADYATLDAADYGVPQHRHRPFWFGHLDGPCIRWPVPTHGDPDDPSVHAPLPGMGLQPWVTCRQALGHLPAEDLGTPVRVRAGRRRDNGTEVLYWSNEHEPAKIITTHPTSRTGVTLVLGSEEAAKSRRKTARTPQSQRGQATDQPARTVRATRTWGAGQLTLNARHPINQPDAPSMCVTTRGGARGGAQGAAAMAWPWDRPSTTVTSRDAIPPPGHHPETGSILSQPAVRLSERAAAILQGFPETWRIVGETKTSRWSQIGQAMPPGLAAAVARSVRAQMAAAAGERRREGRG